MIARRRVMRRGLAGIALLPLLATAARAQRADIAFRVLRQGTPVGTHTVRFREESGLLRARTEMRIQVRLAGFTVFRFTQDTEEAWRGDRLIGLESRADRNGRVGECRAVAEGNGIRLRGTAGEALLPANAAPLTWWRAATLAGGVPVFDVREGRPVEPRLERRAEGGLQRIRVIGGEGADVAYDARGAWVGFATTGEDGSPVTYERA
ncbi:DUF6134 family protein [Falsiroseomonas oryziterrae]|uniref:DUF6134 family protein n=1 Tax=Falsiroseomonas oryziterrae TaxID=2911368 RepID=UPI001F436FA0|nr:DUF6134 family protein [Roseomonas sp. NPKOSM-4]